MIDSYNVALWVPRYWPAVGGTELHTRELAQKLSLKHSLRIITHTDTTATELSEIELDVVSSKRLSYNDLGVTVERLGLNKFNSFFVKYLAKGRARHRWIRPLYSSYFSAQLASTANDSLNNVDMIHFVYNGLTDCAMLAARLANQKNIPFIFTPNTLDTSSTPTAWNSKRFKKLYGQAAAVIALTQFEAEYLRNLGVDDKKIKVIPYGPILEQGVSKGYFFDESGLDQGKIILFLGRVVDSKGYRLLLESRNQIWQSHPGTKIVFIGPASKIARQEILNLNDSRIVLYENVEQKFKTAALKACDILCVPSSVESLGVVYIEAAACAKPVVALDIPVLHGVVFHGKDGYLVSNNADKLTDSLLRLLDNPEMCEQFGSAALKKAGTRFSWENVSNSVSSVYHNAYINHLN